MPLAPGASSHRFRSRIVTGLLWVVVLGLALVGLTRAADLAGDGWAPTAAREARWFAWAWGTGPDRALIPSPFRVSVPGEVEAGMPVAVADPVPGARPPWVHVMTQYALPNRVVTGVGPGVDVASDPSTPSPVVLDGSSPPLFERRSPPLLTRLLELASLALGLGIAGLLGWGLAGGTGGGTGGSRLSRAVSTVLLGLTGAALLAAVAGLLGFPRAAFPVVAVVPAVGLLLRRRRKISLDPSLSKRDAPGPARGTGTAGSGLTLGTDGSRLSHGEGGSRLYPGEDGSRLSRVALGLAAGLALLFVARTALAPLWSWDHFAIWGLKARRIAALGAGPGLFDGPGMGNAFPFAQIDYPLGLPLAWVQLAPFTEPGGWLFRVVHAALGIALVALVFSLARRLGAARAVAALAAAWIAASPLLFDTENLGLAELPLAVWWVAGLSWALAAEDDADGRSPWPAGVLLGFLPWIKAEGLPLMLFAVVALLLVPLREGQRPLGRRLAVAGPALLLAVAARLHAGWVGGLGRGWLDGDFLGRITERLADPGPLLAALGGELVAGPWLGIWIVFFLTWPLVAVGRGLRHPATRIGAAVAAQLALYGLVYFVTFLDPIAHLDSSFARIVAALGPVAAAVVAGSLGSLTATIDPE